MMKGEKYLIRVKVDGGEYIDVELYWRFAKPTLSKAPQPGQQAGSPMSF
jgi:hypothetical protein